MQTPDGRADRARAGHPRSPGIRPIREHRLAGRLSAGLCSAEVSGDGVDGLATATRCLIGHTTAAMRLFCWLLFVTGLYPLGCAWRANRRSSLRHALVWGMAAWLGWGLALAAEDWGPAAS